MLHPEGAEAKPNVDQKVLQLVCGGFRLQLDKRCMVACNPDANVCKNSGINALVLISDTAIDARILQISESLIGATLTRKR